MVRNEGLSVEVLKGIQAEALPILARMKARFAAIDPGDTTALEALLPDRWLAEHPEHRLEQREEESREAQARHQRRRAARRLLAAQ